MRIASEETAITADTALRLGKALGTSAQFWLNLQNEFDVRTAKRQRKGTGQDHAGQGTCRGLRRMQLLPGSKNGRVFRPGRHHKLNAKLTRLDATQRRRRYLL